MAWKIGIPQFPGRLGWLILLLICINLAPTLLPRLFEPSPYRNVDVVTVEERGTHIRIVANFEKTACTFRRLTVVGFVADATDILSWRDGFGLPPDFDRETGTQTLDIEVMPRHREYDWLEIRTRHDCDGQTVDRVFAHIDLPEGLTN